MSVSFHNPQIKMNTSITLLSNIYLTIVEIHCKFDRISYRDGHQLISLYLPLLWKYLKHCADQPPLYSLVHPLTHWTRPTHSLPGIHWPAAASPGNSPVTAVPSKLFSARALWLTAAASLPICLSLCFCLCLNCLCPLCHIMFTENRELCKPLSLHNKIATIHICRRNHFKHGHCQYIDIDNNYYL